MQSQGSLVHEYRPPRPSPLSCLKHHPLGILIDNDMQFCAAELTRALDENAYGVRSFRQDGANAVIATMEGKEITVQCVNDGFVIKDGQTYETLDSLLINNSPGFMKKMNGSLMDKLMALRNEREEQER